MSNVTALPGFSLPSHDPVEKVIEILEEALEAARAGKIVGVGMVTVERDPTTFVTRFHATQNGRHSLGSGVLALGWQIGKVFSEDD